MDQLRAFLKERAESAGVTAEVYIELPPADSMVYPCIVISRDVGRTKFADNGPYRHTPRYLLKGISQDVDSPLYGFLASLPTSIHNRSYPADNLNHDVFTISFQEEQNEA